MKKILYFVIAFMFLLLIVGIFLHISFINSPKYALQQISKDIKEEGVDGLIPHLTDDAQKTVDAITTVTENKFMNAFLSLIGKSDYASILKSNLKKVEWSLNDIMEGKENTDVVIGFNYDDKLIGTIDVKMLKENKEWKISGIDIPKISKINF